MVRDNWIKARAECTPDQLLERLKDILNSDIERFNGIAPASRRQNRLFVLTDTDGKPPYAICRAQFFPPAYRSGPHLEPVAEDADDCVRVYLSGSHIGACRKDHWSIRIFPVWNDETLTCDFFVKDGDQPASNQPRSLDQISQHILGNFLFL